jgi:outer membrane lipoprotein SlyB
MRTRCNLIRKSLVLLACCAAVAPALSQRAGQSMSVQYGTVSGARPIDLSSSGAVPAGVLVGGTLGLLSASGKSSGKKARNAAIGAAATGAVAAGSQGHTRGTLYDVDLGSQGKIQVVSDQQEIRTGDCVAVEKAGETANIRRVTAAYCESANAAAVKAVADSAAAEAQECLQAKQQLVDATSTSAADLAGKKVELLCND